MNIPRSCGVILHIVSLPSPYGIGDLGPSAFRFADFLAAGSIRFWQILPLNYTDEGSGFSPYSGLSAFAGNPFMISPELLLEEGLLDEQDLRIKKPFSDTRVDYPAVVAFKRVLFDAAYCRFENGASPTMRRDFEQFCEENREWLADYALYMALKTRFEGKPWYEWPEAYRSRQEEVMQAAQTECADDLTKQQFLQFLFFRQWNQLKQYCEDRQIRFIGDLPFYVGYDSSDVWAHPQYFKLDKERKPELVAGVPPDYFSETGQLWGMPIFNWDVLKKEGYSWWLDRIEQNLKMFGLLRLDHFRAFAAYWEVPATEKTAIRGKWVAGPGNDFFVQLKKRFPDLPFIAEDLGEIDQPVRDLMARFSLPGMRVLQFAFGDDMPRSGYVPHHHIPDSIVYTGTHDNNTIVGWYEHDLGKKGRQRLAAYLGRKLKKETIHEEMIRLALQSVGRLAVFPLQDLLGLGQEAIMNKPSTTKGNWSWRFTEEQLSQQAAERIRTWLHFYDREGEFEVPKRRASKKKTGKNRSDKAVEA
jgi:4-alpha-glucanotransferase